jgi:hypothetical protein
LFLEDEIIGTMLFGWDTLASVAILTTLLASSNIAPEK